MNYIIQYRNNDYRNATIFLPPSSSSIDDGEIEILEWLPKANRYFVLLRKAIPDVAGGYVYRVDEITIKGDVVSSSPEKELVSETPLKVSLEVQGDRVAMVIPSRGFQMSLSVPGEHTNPDVILGDPDPSPRSGGGGVSPIPGGDDEEEAPPPAPDYSVDNPDEVIETLADRSFYIPEYINVRDVIIEVVDRF